MDTKPRLSSKVRDGLRILASLVESGDMSENVTGYEWQYLTAEDRHDVAKVEAACKWIWSLKQ